MWIVPCSASLMSLETTLPETTLSADTPNSWVWNGSFIKLDLDQSNLSPVGKAACKTIAISVNSTLCEPVNAQVTTVDGRLHEDDCLELNCTGLTWELSDEELAIISTKLWETVKDGNALGLLPRFCSNDMFPYRNSLRGMYICS